MKILDSEIEIEGWNKITLTGIFAWLFYAHCALWVLDAILKGVLYFLKLIML